MFWEEHDRAESEHVPSDDLHGAQQSVFGIQPGMVSPFDGESQQQFILQHDAAPLVPTTTGPRDTGVFIPQTDGPDDVDSDETPSDDMNGGDSAGAVTSTRNSKSRGKKAAPRRSSRSRGSATKSKSGGATKKKMETPSPHPAAADAQEDAGYAVELVLGKREVEGKFEYLCKWEGYAWEFNTWEGA